MGGGGSARARPSEGGGNPAKNANSAKKAINQMNLPPINKNRLKNQINKGNKPEIILRNARALARERARSR